MSQHLLALCLTIFGESTILWLLLRRGPYRIIANVALISCFTLPIATYFYQNNIYDFITIEAAVVLVESILIMVLFKLKYGKAWLYSLAANAVTALLGLVVVGKGII